MIKKKTTCSKALCVLLFILLIVSGCDRQEGKASLSDALGSGSEEETSGEESRLQVVTTIFPQYDFARAIAGDSADVTMLLKPGEEVHSYEPTPQDIKMIQNSDLFIYTGGENDVWVESILESIKGDTEGLKTVRLLDLVQTVSETQLEGMTSEKGHDHDHGTESETDHDHETGTEADHDHETETEADHDHETESETDHDHETGTEADHDHETETEADHDHETETEADHDHETGTGSSHAHSHAEEPDEHVWTSPENCVIIIDKLTDEFCGADPANAAEYRANGDSYREKFEELDAKYRKLADSATRKTILFGDRFPFRYLAEELGLTCYAAFSGCSSESEPSAATIAFLINKAAEEKFPVVFKIEFSNGYIARAVSEAANLRIKKIAGKANTAEIPEMQVLQLHSCHNLTRDEFEAGETCLSLMEKNLEVLRIALGAPAEE